MILEEYDFDPVDSASAGALGEPGKRTFMIQGRKQDALIGILVEKQQIELLANQSIEFLDSLSSEFPEEEVATPQDFEIAGTVEPIEPLFRAQSMGLIFDPDSQLITLELRELPFEEESETENEFMVAQPGFRIPPEARQDERVVRLTMTRTQLRAMAVRGSESVNAGREPCPLCQNPMDVTGHICPRLN